MIEKLLVALAVLSLSISSAFAHCGKPHADEKNKDKTSSSQTSKAE